MSLFQPNSIRMSSSVIMVILAAVMDPWNCLSVAAVPLGLGQSRLRRSPKGTIHAIRHGGCSPYHGGLAQYSLVAVSSLRGHLTKFAPLLF
jgi:hypothetical protein